MIFCIAGKNKIAIEIAKLIRAKEFELIAIINKTDDGNDNWQPSYLRFCLKNKIQIVELEEIYNLRNLIFLSLEFDKLVNPKLFKSQRLFNLHFSLLPKYKGMYTSIWPILNNEQYSGITLHKIDSGIDTGDIIDQIKIKIKTNYTSEDLYMKFINEGIELIKANLDNLIENTCKYRIQPIRGSSYYSKNSIDFKNLNLDTNQTAFCIYNFIRAFTFRPYQLPEFNGCKIYRSKITKDRSILKAGSLIKEDDYKFIISTIDYNIILYKDLLDDLFKSIELDQFDIFLGIVNSGYPLELKNNLGWDAFIVGSYFGRVRFLRFLLSRGLNVNTVNYKGTSALMYSMSNFKLTHDSSCFDFLIENGADIFHTDNSEKNIFDYSTGELYPKLEEILKNTKK